MNADKQAAYETLYEWFLSLCAVDVSLRHSNRIGYFKNLTENG